MTVLKFLNVKIVIVFLALNVIKMFLNKITVNVLIVKLKMIIITKLKN